ncbi:hypothetical protein D3C87_2119530 [compost metagenome]
MIEHRRAQAAGYPGKHPEDHPDKGGGNGNQQCGTEGGGGAGQQAAENVAAKIVGAQEEGNVAVT